MNTTEPIDLSWLDTISVEIEKTVGIFCVAWPVGISLMVFSLNHEFPTKTFGFIQNELWSRGVRLELHEQSNNQGFTSQWILKAYLTINDKDKDLMSSELGDEIIEMLKKSLHCDYESFQNKGIVPIKGATLQDFDFKQKYTKMCVRKEREDLSEIACASKPQIKRKKL